MLENTVPFIGFFFGSDPGSGNGTAIPIVTPATAIALSNNISVAGMPDGNYLLSVRAKDIAGNWGPSGTMVLTVDPPNPVFSNGFDTGTFAAWTSTLNAGTRITTKLAAAKSGSFGMAALISGGTSGYVVDGTPQLDKTYHARFYVHPNGVTLNATERDIFVGLSASNQTLFRIQMRKNGNSYQLRSLIYRAGGTTATNWYAVSNAYHAVEMSWQSATSSSSGFYIDGVLRQTLTNLTTSSYRLDSVRLGPQGSLGNTAGTMYFDSFVSTRYTVIGP